MEEKIFEGNELIAKYFSAKIEGDYYFFPNRRSQFKTGWFQLSRMDFHTSWDWLMPVVEKISEENNFSLSSVGMWACYFNRKDSDDPTDSICDRGGFEPLIMNVWHCVVDYLKWREKQPKYKTKQNG